MRMELTVGLQRLALAITAGMCIYSLISLLRRKEPLLSAEDDMSRGGRDWLFLLLITAVAAAVRLVAIDTLPLGLNQDEASIGYDSFALAFYGVDRNGYPFPVYPVVMGAGQGPFSFYMTMPFVRLLGLTKLSLRLPVAVLNTLAVPGFYFLTRRLAGRRTGLIAAALLAVAPFHILLSRWNLDANTVPAMMIFSAWALLAAFDKKSCSRFALAGGLYALTLYTYGQTYITIPLLLGVTAVFWLIRRDVQWKHILSFLGAAILVALPLAVFYGVNLLGLPEIRTAWFSVPKLTVLRSGAVFYKHEGEFAATVLKNIPVLLKLLLGFSDGFHWNAVKGFLSLYVFSIPFLAVGLLLLCVRTFRRKKDVLMLAWLLGALALGLVIEKSINRLNGMYVPLLYCVALGIDFVLDRIRRARPVVLGCYAVGFVLFCCAYFGPYQRDTMSAAFHQGYGEALAFAREQSDGADVYITDRPELSYIRCMFYTKVPPEEFQDTVEYVDENAEFRVAKRFSNYVFSIPEAEAPEAVYMLHEEDAPPAYLESYQQERFYHYVVYYKAP